MNIKRIMLAVMCVLLATVVVMTGILVSRVAPLLQGLGGLDSLMNGGNSTAASTTKPAESTPPTQTEPSQPPTTQPTQPPTTQPTQPPTTQPPEPTETEHTHEYAVESHVEATCENLGYDLMVCTGCGRQDIQNFVDPVGHDYGPGQTIAPTCTEYGCTRSVCSRCGGVRERNKQEALGHDHQLTETVAPTCEEVGYEKHTCSRCPDVVNKNEVPALGHNDVQVGILTEATCTTDGVAQMECTGCQRKTEQPIPATGHTDEQVGILTEATCTTDGVAQMQCSACQQQSEQVIPATGHTYGEWVFSESGMSRICGTCSAEETVAFADLTITKVESQELENGRELLIFVGTDTAPELIQYKICDFLNNGSLSYDVAADRGLVVTYEVTNGNQIELVRNFNEPGTIEITAAE